MFDSSGGEWRISSIAKMFEDFGVTSSPGSKKFSFLDPVEQTSNATFLTRMILFLGVSRGIKLHNLLMKEKLVHSFIYLSVSIGDLISSSIDLNIHTSLFSLYFNDFRESLKSRAELLETRTDPKIPKGESLSMSEASVSEDIDFKSDRR